MGVKLTERDIKTLEFLGKWRFCTVEQLQKAGIFCSSPKKCKNRLLILRNNGLIKSSRLESGKMYYGLTPRGGEVIDLPDAWHSSRYRFARSAVINQLILTDFALAVEAEYIPREKVLERFMKAKYSELRKIFKSNDVFFEKDGVLHVLVTDNQLSLKYFSERVKAYSKLPADLQEGVVIVFFGFQRDQEKPSFKAGRRGCKNQGLEGKLEILSPI